MLGATTRRRVRGLRAVPGHRRPAGVNHVTAAKVRAVTDSELVIDLDIGRLTLNAMPDVEGHVITLAYGDGSSSGGIADDDALDVIVAGLKVFSRRRRALARRKAGPGA